MEYEIRNHREC